MSESNDRRIDDATPDTDVTGAEKVPVSDGGTAKCLTIEQIKDFVATKFAALSDASGVAVNSDGVYLKKDGELKPVAANVFADALIAFMFGKDAETELSETDEIVINRGGTAKTATVEAVANIVKEIVQFDAFDIHSLPSASYSFPIDSDVEFAISYKDGDGEFHTGKTGLQSFIEAIFQHTESVIPDDQTFDDDSDEIVVNASAKDDDSNSYLKSVPLSSLGLGKGDVNGPSANTDGKIPTWNGNNSKRLNDGLNLVQEIGTGSSTAVPSSIAVKNALYGVVKYRYEGTGSPAAGKIPRWANADGHPLEDGLVFATSLGNTPSDEKVLSEKAVSDAIASAFTNALASGGSIQSAISSAISAALVEGGVIFKQIRQAVDVVSTPPSQGAYGYERGQCVYCTQVGNLGIYLNQGSFETASWVRFTPAS